MPACGVPICPTLSRPPEAGADSGPHRRVPPCLRVNRVLSRALRSLRGAFHGDAATLCRAGADLNSRLWMGAPMASLTERMIGAMQADVKTFEEVEKDPAALGQAVTVIVIAAVASLIGNIFRDGLGPGIAGLLGTLIGYGVWTVLVVVIGTKLMPEPATHANFSEG